jgi:hypothetical protein
LHRSETTRRAKERGSLERFLRHLASDLLAGIDIEAVVDASPDPGLCRLLAERQETIAIQREEASELGGGSRRQAP